MFRVHSIYIMVIENNKQQQTLIVAGVNLNHKIQLNSFVLLHSSSSNIVLILLPFSQRSLFLFFIIITFGGKTNNKKVQLNELQLLHVIALSLLFAKKKYIKSQDNKILVQLLKST